MDLFVGLVVLFFIIILKNFYFNISFIIIKKNFFFHFFLPFPLSYVADRVLVRWLGVRPEPLRWESLVQDTGPQETSQPLVISLGESSHRDLRLKAKTQLHPMASKTQCWMSHAKQLARQEHNPTH